MPLSPQRYQRFFAELKRRRVFRVIALYGAMSFAALEVADLVVPRLALPDSSVTYLVWVVIVGFPLVTVLSWFFDLTSQGILLTPEARPEELERILRAPLYRRWPSGLLAIIGMCLLLGGGWYAGRQSVPPSTDGVASDPVPSSIAVLPFLDLSQEENQEYLAEGITEELLGLLAGIPELRVAARTSSFSFRGMDLGIPEIGRRLNVTYVLEGSMRKSGNQVRVSAQLMQAREGFQIWSDTWDLELGDIFAIQDEIAVEVLRGMGLPLLGQAPRVMEADPEAYGLFLQGRQLGRMGTPEGWESSNALYEEALTLDPGYAPAWAELARNYINQTASGLRSVGEGNRMAHEAAENGLALDPSYGPAHAALGLAAMNSGGDLATAAAHFQRAMELAPTSLDILSAAARLAQELGRMETAVGLREYMVARDPMNFRSHQNLGMSYFFDGRYEEAEESFRTALRLSPGLIGGYYFIGLSQLLQNDAIAALASFSVEADDESRIKGTALALHTLGRMEEHERAFMDLRIRWGDQWPSEVAQVYAWVGDPDSAFQWLDRAVTQGEEGITDPFLWPFFIPLHGDPRWRSFRERTGTSRGKLESIAFQVSVPAV